MASLYMQWGKTASAISYSQRHFEVKFPITKHFQVPGGKTVVLEPAGSLHYIHEGEGKLCIWLL